MYLLYIELPRTALLTLWRSQRKRVMEEREGEGEGEVVRGRVERGREQVPNCQGPLKDDT